MVRRGYRVTYVTSQGYSRLISSLGAEVVIAPSLRNERPGEDPAEFVSSTISETLSDVTPFYEDDRADLILYEFNCRAGRILAEKWGIPAIQFRSDVAFGRDHCIRSADGPDINQLQELEGRLNNILQGYGLSGNYLFDPEDFSVYLYPLEFQLDNSVAGRCFYAGRCPGEHPWFPKWRPNGALQRPIVLVSSSTGILQGPEFYRMCIDALVGTHLHIVLAIGDHNDRRTFEGASNFEVFQNLLLIQAMPHADLIICQGGITTAAEAMYHGVPLLMTTQGSKLHEFYADRFAELGIGRHLTMAETSANSVRTAVLEMLVDLDLRQKVRGMQRAVQTGGGAEETVNRISEYLATYSGRA
jgi:MGT family glycosyltransferase